MGFFHDDYMPYDPLFDLNNDGHIDFAEFGYYLDVMKKQQEEFDGNHSGSTIWDADDESENEDELDAFSVNSRNHNSWSDEGDSADEEMDLDLLDEDEIQEMIDDGEIDAADVDW